MGLLEGVLVGWMGGLSVGLLGALPCTGLIVGAQAMGKASVQAACIGAN